MRVLICIALCLCLVVSTISAEKKSSHKHADTKKLLKVGGHEQQHDLKQTSPLKLDEAPKSPLPLKEDVAEPKANGGRNKHHRHGKNKKGGHHASEQQQQNGGTSGRSRKSHHAKQKVNNNNGPAKPHHNKQGRKHGRGKQTQ